MLIDFVKLVKRHSSLVERKGLLLLLQLEFLVQLNLLADLLLEFFLRC